MSGLGLGFGYFGAITLAGAWSESSLPPWSDFEQASAFLPWLGAALAPVQQFVMAALAGLLIVTSANALTAFGSRRRTAGALGVFLIGFLVAPGPTPYVVMSWALVGAVSGVFALAAYHWFIRACPALVVLAAAAFSILSALADGVERAYSGALAGSLLATVGIAVLAWRWFDWLTVRELPPGVTDER